MSDVKLPIESNAVENTQDTQNQQQQQPCCHMSLACGHKICTNCIAYVYDEDETHRSCEICKQAIHAFIRKRNAIQNAQHAQQESCTHIPLACGHKICIERNAIVKRQHAEERLECETCKQAIHASVCHNRVKLADCGHTICLKCSEIVDDGDKDARLPCETCDQYTEKAELIKKYSELYAQFKTLANAQKKLDSGFEKKEERTRGTGEWKTSIADYLQLRMLVL